MKHSLKFTVAAAALMASGTSSLAQAAQDTGSDEFIVSVVRTFGTDGIVD